MNFSNQLLNWYDQNKRELEWRKTTYPYSVWLSEVIMQQTQIIQGTPYYLKFIKTYPTIFDLARAEEREVLLLWQGLGYYSRGRNLLETAKYIVSNFNGVFPDNYKALITLSGIGDYTASAILSVCFNKAVPAIDGNVLRLISRFYEIKEPVNKASGRNTVKKICETLISDKRPGDFNQAMMDYSSVVCSPKKPDCIRCIFNNDCISFKNNHVECFPIKEKNPTKKSEYWFYFIIQDTKHRKLYIEKRNEGIWKNLYQFPVFISLKKISEIEALNKFVTTNNLPANFEVKSISDEYKHILSHKILYVKFFVLKSSFFANLNLSEQISFVSKNNLSDYPFPAVINKYINQGFTV